MLKKKELWLSRATLLLSMILCFAAGRLSWQYEHHRDIQPLVQLEDQQQEVSIIHLEEIEHGKVMGRTNDPFLRIHSGESFAVPEEDLSFELDITHLGYLGEKRPKITIEVPEWAQYIASKSGKYYYSLTEKQAKKLSAANHIYFATKEEAEAAGKIFRGR